jgi:peptide deformylase
MFQLELCHLQAVMFQLELGHLQAVMLYKILTEHAT